jgi:urease accessory protein
MFEISQVFSNIHHDKEILKLLDNNSDELSLTRIELSKNRMRKNSKKGLDLGLNLPSGTHLHDGDVLKADENLIVIRQMPEKTIVLNLKNKVTNDELVLLGHIIGNRHKAIQLEKGKIYFPIINDVELETFKILFQRATCTESIKIEERVFFPSDGADVHEH